MYIGFPVALGVVIGQPNGRAERRARWRLSLALYLPRVLSGDELGRRTQATAEHLSLRIGPTITQVVLRRVKVNPVEEVFTLSRLDGLRRGNNHSRRIAPPTATRT